MGAVSEELVGCLVEEHLSWARAQSATSAPSLGAAQLGAVLPPAEAASPLTLVTGPYGAGKTRFLEERARRLIALGAPPDSTLLVNAADARLPTTLPRTFLADVLEAYLARAPLARHQPIHLFIDNIESVEDWPRFIRSLIDAYPARIWAADACASWLSSPRAKELPADAHVHTMLGPTTSTALRQILARVADDAKSADPVHEALKRFYRLGRASALDEAACTERTGERHRHLARLSCAADVARKLPSTALPLIMRTAALMIGASGTDLALSSVQRSLAAEGMPTTRATVRTIADALEDAHLICRIGGLGKDEDSNPRAAQLICACDHGLAQALAPAPLAPEPLLTSIVFEQLYEAGLSSRVRTHRPRAGRKRLIAWTEPGKGAPTQLIATCACKKGERLPASLVSTAALALSDTGLSHLTVVTAGAAEVRELDEGALSAVPLGEWLLERAGIIA
ncbi:AAA family ATPase [Adlercreutzia sp. ZJ473]|uniref:AAA family ATPase n=1 Tax=Adlercreutzia sp. ZJ473 TaxID=2722822 RepID=UPI00155748C0|nr:AAA family ATPase [Adlercreutzia sp. ZJ473]